ncbi:MAG: peptidoglycan DD-metalloendopeptidase family protein, partial [Oscillospiraceae bacterium]|nr:peptidoglycan DD-metalloendopeptidase family protein [Oscillospiraceae bacterium]
QIAEYDRLAFEKEYLLQKSVENEEDRREQYKNSLRAKEERGTASYYEIILGAQDWTDLLSRFDFVRDVMNYDESVYNALVDARTTAEKARAALEETEAEKEASGEKLSEKQAELNDLVAQADGYIAGLEGDLDSYMELTAERDTAENALFTRLEDLAAETERMRSISSTGTVIWPSEDSRYVSNGFGGHTHPVFGAYSVHYGIDIAAAYGTRVMAVDGGIVVEAGYDSACGNYVLITHGNGVHTFYANLSKLSVASGDTVSQGTVIGLVGSTGVSTTPHLFFQTIRGGARVNPLEFYSNYELSPSA